MGHVLQDHQPGRSGLANDSDEAKDHVTKPDDWLPGEGIHKALLLPRPPPCCQGTAVGLRCVLHSVIPRLACCFHGATAALQAAMCAHLAVTSHSFMRVVSGCNVDTAS